MYLFVSRLLLRFFLSPPSVPVVLGKQQIGLNPTMCRFVHSTDRGLSQLLPSNLPTGPPSKNISEWRKANTSLLRDHAQALLASRHGTPLTAHHPLPATGMEQLGRRARPPTV